jgi:hypothetical protein
MGPPEAIEASQNPGNGEQNLPRQGKDFTFSDMRAALYSG